MAWVLVGARSVSLTVEAGRARVIEWSASANPSTVKPGDTVTIMVTVGTSQGAKEARCYALVRWLDGVPYKSQEFTVPPNTTGFTSLDLKVPVDQEPGTYSVSVELYEWVD